MGIYQISGKAKTSKIIKTIIPNIIDEHGKFRHDCAIVQKQERVTKQELRKALSPDPYPEDVDEAYYALDIAMKNILMATDIKDKVPCPVLTDEYPPEYKDLQYCEPTNKKKLKEIDEKIASRGWFGQILPGGFEELHVPGEIVCSCPINDGKQKAWYKMDTFDDGRNYTRDRCIDGKRDDITSLELRRQYDNPAQRFGASTPGPKSIQLAWTQFDRARHGSTKDKVAAIDKLIHSVHDRGPMSGRLVEGGLQTLEELAGHKPEPAFDMNKILNEDKNWRREHPSPLLHAQ